VQESISKEERLAEFLRRLGSAPAAKAFEEAYSQICNILNEVEDELTAIPNEPENWQTDGRLYPPKLDNVRTVPSEGAIKRFRSVGHNTFIGENGSIEIEVIQTKEVIFSKAGEDGRKVHEL
jgi:hypothetical protein